MSASKGQAYLSGFSLLAKLQSYSLLSSADDSIEYDSCATDRSGDQSYTISYAFFGEIYAHFEELKLLAELIFL